MGVNSYTLSRCGGDFEVLVGEMLVALSEKNPTSTNNLTKTEPSFFNSEIKQR